MLEFPKWKIGLIVGILIWGLLSAFPNLMPDSTLGKAPRQPLSQTTADVAQYEADKAAAAAATWPSFLPSSKVNLGLDLQGGVFLLMQIDPDQVINSQLENFQTDVRNTLVTRPRVRHTMEVTGTRLEVRLRDAADKDTALERIRDVNPTIGGLGSSQVFTIRDGGAGRISITIEGSVIEALNKQALNKTQQIVRRRVDPDGVREIVIQPQGDRRLSLEAPGEADSKRIRELLQQAGKMTFNLTESSPAAIQAAQNGMVMAGFELLSGDGRTLLVNKTPEIVGSEIASANQGFDETGRPNVQFRMNSSGTRKFFRTTKNNTGRIFAIVLDGQIMSAPRINEPIPGGSVQITGDFTLEEAQDLSAIIEAGELPAKIEFVQERTVGPSLGEASIKAGTRASMIGLGLVAIFMVLIYRLLGVFAVMSLTLNIVLIIASLSMLGATLTLPGIAGIILTIGMAVDANVLVFERIREEMRSGRSPITAVQAGYERALVTILDANITTFIAATVLYMFGSGPVKGFAVTLAFGIVTSVFTAFVVTRWFMAMWIKTARPKTLSL